jgi:hypothetical protein
MPLSKSTPLIAVGQVWKDNDPRITKPRLLTIKAINERVLCEITEPDGTQRGRTTVIAKKRFRPTSTGYMLVQEAPEQ